MVTNVEEPRPDLSPAEQNLRMLIGGHPKAAIRRIILYAVVAVSFFVCAAAIGWGPAAVAPSIGATALILLALTDQLT